MDAYDRHSTALAVSFTLLWAALAVGPVDRADWVLENVLLVPVVLILLAAWRRRLFSRLSLSLIFVFLCLHEVGAHYTYSKVPYDEAWRAITGGSLNEWMGWRRNHYDRLLHFLYGFLLAYPVREIFLRVARVRGFWGYFLPLDLTLSSSAFFEMIEWAVAVFIGGDAGQAYVGTQGDEWDAHKDMALASLGAVATMLITALVNRRCQRDFAREWSESLRLGRGEA